MSIVQRIRERAAWIITGAIALAMIAFIVQDAFQGGSSRLFGGRSTTLGSVNGTKIDYIEFEQRVKLIEEQYQRMGYPMDEEFRLQQRNRLWEDYVEKDLLSKEFDELGLEVTEKELGDILYGVNPPQDLRQQFTDPKTGQYDANAAYQQIQQLKRQKSSAAYKNFFGDYIPALIRSHKKEKLQSLITNSAYVPKWAVEKMNADNSQVASFTYVNIPYGTISDSTIKPSDDEIAEFVKKHKEIFKQEKARGIEYVMFDAAPSKADSMAVFKQLLNLKDSFQKATDIKDFLVKEYSQSPFYDSYIQRKEIKIQNIDSILKTPVGQDYGPYMDGNSYVLARVLDVKTWPDTVKVRQILVATHQPNNTGELVPVREDSTAKKLIDSIALAIRNGSNFDSLLTFSDDPGSKDKKGIYDNVITGKMTPAFNDFVFSKKTGDKGVIKTEYGYHYIEILSQKGSSPAYKIAYLSKPILASDETVNTAQGAAAQFAAESRTKKQFDENADKKKLNKINAADVKPLDVSINGLPGNARELVRWMFNDAKIGEVAEKPYLIGDKYVVPVLVQAYEEGTMTVERARPQAEVMIRNKKKAEQISKKIASATTLETVSKTVNRPVDRIDSLLFSSPGIPNVGREMKVLGAAFNKSYISKISEPIPGDLGVFVIKVEKIGAVANPNIDIKQQQSMMIQQQKFMNQQRWIEAIRKAAKIKDYRYKFF